MAKGKVIAFLLLLPLVSFLVTLLILAIPYGIANAIAHAVGGELESADYWTYIFQNGYFWPTFIVVLIFSPIVTFVAWKILEDY